MPIHGTMTPNEKKEHDDLHKLFVDGVLSRCYCTCKQCWHSQKVQPICYDDKVSMRLFTGFPVIVTDEDRERYGTYRRRVA